MLNPATGAVKDDALPNLSSTWNWKVLLADDDALFHKIGHALLSGVEFDGHTMRLSPATIMTAPVCSLRKTPTPLWWCWMSLWMTPPRATG